MPATYRIDAKHELVISTVDGHMADPQLLEHEKALAEDADVQSYFNQIYDCRRLTLLSVTGAAAASFRELNQFSDDARRAFVTTSNLHYGLLRMFLPMAGLGKQAAVFDNVREALAWLGVPTLTPAQRSAA